MDLSIIEALSIVTEAISKTIPDELVKNDNKIYLSKDGKALSEGLELPTQDSTLPDQDSCRALTNSEIEELIKNFK